MRLREPRMASLALAFIVACGGGGGGGETRVLVPSGYSKFTPIPLVVFVHGYDPGNPNVVQAEADFFRLSDAAETRTVLLALPEGPRDFSGTPYWNGSGCCDVDGRHPDHVTALRKVIADVEGRYAVDPRRVFLIGVSNGAFMAHRMGCEAADLVAAFVAISGDVWDDPSLCKPTSPVAVLQVHGTADLSVPYGGGSAWTGTTWPSAEESVATWASLNGCTGTLTDAGMRLDLVSSLPGTETVVEGYSCETGAAELWKVEGGGHVPDYIMPGTTERLIDWLLAHPKS